MRLLTNSVVTVTIALLCLASTSNALSKVPKDTQLRRFGSKQLTSSNIKSQQHTKIARQRRHILDDASACAKSTLVRGGNVDSVLASALKGVGVLAIIETVIKKLLQLKGYKFPSMLGGCLFMFTFMILADLISPGLGDYIFTSLSPAAALLAKWVGCFFVPGLVTLPLAPSFGSGIELVKVFCVVLVGFFFSLSTVSFSVLGLRTLQGTAISEAPPSNDVVQTKGDEKEKSTPKPKVFSDLTLNILRIGALVSLPVSIIATRLGLPYTHNLHTIAMIFTTVFGFVWSARLPGIITKIVHPIIFSALISLLTTQLIALSTGSTFLDVLRLYKVGSLIPTKAGAGDILLYLLGPTVVSFSISMYGRKKLIKENLPIIAWAMVMSAMGGLFATAAFARLINLGGKNDVLRLSILTRSITTPLAIQISLILGGNMSIAATMAIATSILGGTYGRSILSAMGIHDPISRGLAIGAAGQSLGVASLAGEPDAFPFAALSLVLGAIFATCMVCFPPVQHALVKLALGYIPAPTP